MTYVYPARLLQRISTKLYCKLHTSRATYQNERSRLRPCFLHKTTSDPPKRPRKVTVIGGGGQVGRAVSLIFFLKPICDEIWMLDINTKQVTGEALDMLHGAAFVTCPELNVCEQIEDTASSDVIVVTLGKTIEPKNPDRLALLNVNRKLLEQVIPNLAHLSPKAVFIVLSNPVDLMTYYTWKYSKFDPHRILGTGCELDTGRFQHYIARKFNINRRSVLAYVMGEHGDSSVPAWSTVAIGGTRLLDIDPNVARDCDIDNWRACHEDVVRAGMKVHNLKGCTNWAVGLTAYNLAKAVLTNARTIHCCSVHCRGMYSVASDVFMSVPSVLGTNGSEEIVKMKLNHEEKCGILHGEKLLLQKISTVKE